jgi:mRNA interferase MazF
MTAPDHFPDAGDLVWTEFDPAKGREQAGRRPALVVSPAVFTKNTGFAIVCPITSRVRPFPTSVVIPPGMPIEGEILVSHVRSIDVLARPLIFSGAKASVETARAVRGRLELLITI